jgi:hypothetical protein
VVVCCSAGFWKKGNIDIVCKRYGHTQVDTIKELIESIKKEFTYLLSMDKDFDVENCSIGWNKSKKE